MDGGWDERIMSAVAEHRTGGATAVANLVMDAGMSSMVLAIITLIALLVVVWRRPYRLALAAGLSWGLAALVVQLLKPVFGRARPPSDLALVTSSSPSFPSTHAAMTSAIAVAVLLTCAWSTRRRAAAATAVLLALVVFAGVCMVYLGAHWPSDVLAGWALGSVIGGSLGLVLRRRTDTTPPVSPAPVPKQASHG